MKTKRKHRVDSVLVLAAMNMGCVSVVDRDITDCRGQVYSYKISGANSAQNTIRLCLEGDKVLWQIDFPNIGTSSAPTICRSAGSASYGVGDELRISTQLGSCENGRTLTPSELTCINQKTKSMVCTNTADGFVYRFQEAALPADQ